jgi:hypothetical protein
VFKPKPSYDLLVKATLIALCPIFFAVQLFFNIGVNRYAGIREITYFHSGPAEQRQTDLHTKPVHHHHGFRLNKHFQPESLPSCNPISIEAPVEYLPSRNLFPDSGHFIPAPFPDVRALRGPPAVNNLS